MKIPQVYQVRAELSENWYNYEELIFTPTVLFQIYIAGSKKQ